MIYAAIATIAILYFVMRGAATPRIFEGFDGAPVSSGLDFPPNITQWAGIVKEAARASGVPEALIYAVIWQESSGNPNARGSVGEVGLMQLRDIAVLDLFENGKSTRKTASADPAANVMDGSQFLKLQYKRMGSNWSEALRAYNAGASGAKSNPKAGLSYADAVMKKATGAGWKPSGGASGTW